MLCPTNEKSGSLYDITNMADFFHTASYFHLILFSTFVFGFKLLVCVNTLFLCFFLMKICQNLTNILPTFLCLDSFFKLPSKAKPGSWLYFRMVTRRTTIRITSPKFSEKEFLYQRKSLHVALSYQNNRIAPLNKILITPVISCYGIFRGELYFSPKRGCSRGL